MDNVEYIPINSNSGQPIAVLGYSSGGPNALAAAHALTPDQNYILQPTGGPVHIIDAAAVEFDFRLPWGEDIAPRGA